MNEEAIRNDVYPGARIGRWTVLADQKTDRRGEALRLCKCECGTYRFVRERALRYGESCSCGCAQQEASRGQAYDLSGRTFGDLKVLGRSNKRQPGRGVWWWCKCKCGNICEVTATALVTGKTNPLRLPEGFEALRSRRHYKPDIRQTHGPVSHGTARFARKRHLALPLRLRTGAGHPV